MRAVTSDDFAAAWLRFRSGAVATITISMVEGTRLHRLTLAGTSGSARIEEQAPLRVELGEGPREIGVEDELPASGELGIPDSDWARSFLRLARRLCAAIRRGETRLDGAADFEDGHRNQLVLDAIRRSDESASWIAV
jgi:predicted dehydrogenase